MKIVLTYRFENMFTMRVSEAGALPVWRVSVTQMRWWYGIPQGGML